MMIELNDEFHETEEEKIEIHDEPMIPITRMYVDLAYFNTLNDAQKAKYLKSVQPISYHEDKVINGRKMFYYTSGTGKLIMNGSTLQLYSSVYVFPTNSDTFYETNADEIPLS